MKVGDMVRIRGLVDKIGMIVFFKSFEYGKNPQPIVMIDGKLVLIGSPECEVISASR